MLLKCKKMLTILTKENNYMKKTITLISAILLSNAALAGGYGYAIKKQTMTCSPGSQCRLEHISDSSGIDEKKNLMGLDAVQTKTSTRDRIGIFHENTELDGTHKIKIVNKNRFKKSYEYVYKLECADLKFSATTIVELLPGGTYTSTDRSVGISKQAPIGRHKITALTRTYDDSSSWGDHAEAALTIRAK